MAFISRTDKLAITSCFVVKCVRSLIPKDTAVLLKFYEFDHN